MGANIETQMRRDLFTHLQKQSFSFFDKSRTGGLMSRILSDLFDITELAHHGPEDLFISAVTIIGSFIILLSINETLTICLFIFLPLLIAFTLFLRKKMSAASHALKENTAEINSQIESGISGIRVSKAFANEKYESEKFFQSTWKYRAARGKFYLVMASFFSGMEFLISLMNVLVIGIGGYLIMEGRMEIIDLVTFTLYISMFLSPIRKLTNFTELFQSGMAGFSRFIDLMKQEPEISDRPEAKTLDHVDGNIIFSHVSFSYSKDDDAENVLDNIDLCIPAGKSFAIVGPSGSGKTTLCHLVPRFYEVKSGQILIDGIDIRDITIDSLRRNVGIVQQDVFLFLSTILENIRYGNLEASDDEVIEAAKKAKLHDFVMSLPDAYDSQVGERGIMLSGGQKQRISIARVFLKNPSILLLDEATSALDTQTEKEIQQSLEVLSQGRTSLIVAHRLSTIRRADVIIYLDEDGIAEFGSHSELMEKKGKYYNLHQNQFSSASA
jgi:ATP-binding cassette subfamily B protein